MTRRSVRTATLLLVAACGGPPPESSADSITSTATLVDSGRLIHAGGIGVARLGTTIATLRATLPAGMSLGAPAPFMVDIDALAVMRGSDSLYYVLAGSGEQLDDSAIITLVATDDTTFRTVDGVGPGVPIADAVRIYGTATLSYNTSDESREYVTFANQPDSSIVFRATSSLEGVLAGVYATNGEYNTTSAYEPHAFIGLVMVRSQR